ncbi:ParA family protein [Pleionea sp. CnH1-48]|uniref:ParA family protein n=1 Tax=Pleionea sp. CnH1-48 TaxID=2954494 RepID=UPI002097BD7A|nr:ParA family protein [Pleionea sp. CnH1-48]MCO7224648.1 ParA family protein [Pleionea sp. CnH1-48]
MKKIAFWSPKGGVGKTTLAINVAAAAYHNRKKVVLCDMDPQHSAADIFNDKKLPFSVFKGVPDVMPHADIMIYDFPPRVDIDIEGDVVVVPMRACIIDMRAVNKALRHVHNKRLVKCVNAVDVRRHDERMMAMKLHSDGARLIKDRSIYSRSIAQGGSVFESQLYGAKDARREINMLYAAILAA